MKASRALLQFPSHTMSPNPRRHHNLSAESTSGRSGFTLIEIVFATMTFAIIMLAIQMTFSGAMKMRNRTETRMERENRILVGLTMVKKDLEGMILTGGAHTGEIFGESSGSGSQSSGTIEFYTSTGTISDNLPWGDIQRIRYYLGDPVLSQFGFNTSTNLGQSLIRESLRNIAAEIEDNPVLTEVVDQVESLNFEFFDGVTWQTSWDSTTSDPAVPVAVRISLQLHRESSTLENPMITTREILVPVFVIKPETEASETDDSGSNPAPQGNASGNDQSSNI